MPLLPLSCTCKRPVKQKPQKIANGSGENLQSSSVSESVSRPIMRVLVRRLLLLPGSQPQNQHGP